MQSSYSVIKSNFTEQGQAKLIETQYVVKNIQKVEELEEAEGKQEEEVKKVPAIDPEELMKRYEDIGQRILQDAKNEKQGILLRAQMEANKAEKEAYEKGYDQGNKNGYEDGYNKAYNETLEKAKLEADEIMDKAEGILKSANDDYAEYLEQKKEEVIRLILDIAENITKKELSNKDSINIMVEEALTLAKGEETVIIKANSIHVEDLKNQIEKWKISYSIKNQIFVLEDDLLEPGNAILEKPTGIVKVGIETGMEQIRKNILNK